MMRTNEGRFRRNVFSTNALEQIASWARMSAHDLKSRANQVADGLAYFEDAQRFQALADAIKELAE